MIANAFRRAGDRLLTLFLPELDRPARAADCWYETICDGDAWGTELYQRHCCYYNTGVRCTPWAIIGYGC